MKPFLTIFAAICITTNALSQISSIKTQHKMKLNAGIVISKLAETKTFYTTILDFGITFENEFYLLMHTPNKEAEISFLLPNHPSQQPLFQKPFNGQGLYLTIEVEDVDKIYNEIKEKNIDIKIDIRNEPWGDRHFAIEDPNGIGIDIVKYSPKEEELILEKEMDKVMWFDIPTQNLDKSAQFYERVFGWDVLPKDAHDSNDALSFRAAITTASNQNNLIPINNGSINGGLVTRDIGITQPTILIQVENIEQKLTQLMNEGGQLVKEKTHLPLAGGYFAYFRDIDDNVLGLWEVEKTTPSSTVITKTNQPNKVTWFSIPSDDMNRAIKFYKEAFNWQIEPETKEDNDVFSFHVAVNSKSDSNYISDEKGVINGCIVKREIGLPTPAVLVEVDDLDTAISKVKSVGGEQVTDKIVMKSLNGVFVLIKDTEGNYVELFQNN